MALEDLALPGLTSSQRPCWSVTFKGTPTDSELTHQAHLLLTLHTTGHCAPALITQVRENRDSSYSWKLTEMTQGHSLLQVPSQLLSLFHRTSIGGPVHSCLTLSASSSSSMWGVASSLLWETGGTNHLSIDSWFLIGWPDQISNFLLVS